MNIKKLKLFDNFLRSVINKIQVFKTKKSDDVILPDQILIIKLSAFGDSLCLIPSLRYFSKSFPDCKIDWLTTGRSSPKTFSEIKFIHEIIIFPLNIFRALIFLPSLIFKIKKYDLVIDCDQYYALSELIALFSRRSVGFSTPIKGSNFSHSISYDPLLNEILQFKLLFDEIPVPRNNSDVSFHADCLELTDNYQPTDFLKNAILNLDLQTKPLIVLYPGSGSNAKIRRWSASNYIELSNFLSEKFTVVFAGGADEIDLKTILSSSKKSIDWIGKWSLTEWAWILRHHTSMFVGNDGGLFHLADSQGARTLGIFGPSLYSKWGSINPRSRHIEISSLECRPCLRGHLGQVATVCARNDVACINQITVSQVLAVFQDAIKYEI
ncbi:glycosyltransferase family 9 protein [Polynucleobacter sp. es-EL-1]|uniref:glycosyltransferase family 9 protein n=1 Tax=Polynucleobacter sp. es-EL-1 TaxID=1855652 RepID=UPI001BFEE9CD|nr:glycosyltransferase family 9 protein [Polynucleobacter sp. es-EL-1]QWE10889.1 glycosyltransferase family 9 protein [Polynucleobacter sp. es-EL-1]